MKKKTMGKKVSKVSDVSDVINKKAIGKKISDKNLENVSGGRIKMKDGTLASRPIGWLNPQG